MSDVQKFHDESRVSHKELGLGTVRTHPEHEDELTLPDASKQTPEIGQVFVVWDDSRFSAGWVDADQLEALEDAVAAQSTGV